MTSDSTVASSYTAHWEEAPQPVVEDIEQEEPLHPRVERARRLRLAWTDEQQGALTRALRYAPNDGAAVAMAPLMLDVA